VSALLPDAEHVLDVGLRRAQMVLRQGGTAEDAEVVLLVAGTAADLLDETQRERLGDFYGYAGGSDG